MANSRILYTESLSKKYGSFLALNDASINIFEGEIYGLIGRNGAGKTTIFKLIMGLSNITSGKIISENRSLIELRNNIGFLIGQQFFSHFNAYQNLNYHRMIKGIKDKNEIHRVLNVVGLDNEKKKFKQFSMGMKQRLGIANALMGDRKIIILDEPINGLDPQGIREVRELILKINKEKNITFIISSHILSELEQIADRFCFIEKGVVRAELPKKEMQNSNGSATLLDTTNNKKTLSLIKKEFDKNAKIVKNHIAINSKIKAEKIVKKIVENGIGVKEVTPQKSNLEDFFLDLVGDEKDV